VRTTAGQTTAGHGVTASLLDNPIRGYAWGSTTALPELLGRPPSGQPQAELWMGAHPADPSLLRLDPPVTLLDRIKADPQAELGAGVQDRFGPRLPFLLKVIAAAAPLSLQAHPNAEQAAAGYQEENASGVPLGAADRNYKDPYHKPELLCPLTPFEAYCGFRPVPETLRLLDLLAEAGGGNTLQGHIQALRARPNQHGLREVVTGLLTKPVDRRGALVKTVAGACRAALAAPGDFEAELRTAIELAEAYPSDVGVVIALLLNLLRLQPGQALFVPAGQLHSYVRGTGMEIMAGSDNVLRGGLTPKHVDVAELLRVLDFTPGPAGVLPGCAARAGEHRYETPAAEFRLSRLRVGAEPVPIGAPGPQILLAVEGSATLTGAGEPLRLARGQSAWVPATAPAALAGDGVLYRATTNVE
jgi:mannose-6-phosphate isomerase